MALCHIDKHASASPTCDAHVEVEEEATNPQEVGGSVSAEKGESQHWATRQTSIA
jgi:hypothetical protein